VRLEGLGQLKDAVTSSGLEPATFWHSEVDSGHTQIHRQHGRGISLLLFFFSKYGKYANKILPLTA
jgi:hypothetical protein